MAIEIAKLLVKIGADTKELEQGLNKSNQNVTSFGKAMQSGLSAVASGFAIAGGAATAFVATWKVASEIGKQGAALEYAAGKFDRLADAIHTTSDALMTDLHIATRGTLSDAQIMQSAGDLMSLGLAKTHDQVVRLSRVTAGLNMDMNQLVLTLANQTTMRFDQLGVSVDGFDARLEKLKKSGLSVNEAFTEAFLQQAEEQLSKVGNAADTTVGSMARLDAAVANVSDAIKRKFSPVVADAAEGLATMLNWDQNLQDQLKVHSREVVKTAGSYEAYVTEMTRAAEAAGYFVSENGDLMKKVFTPFVGIEEITLQTGYLKDNLQYVYESSYATKEGLDALNEAAKDSSAVDTAGFDNLVAGAQNAKTELGNLITQVGNLETSMQNWAQGVGNQAAQMLGQNLWEGSDRFKQGLQVVDDVLGTSFAKEQAQKDSVKALVDQYSRTGNLEAFNAGLTKIRDEGLAGMSTELDTAQKRAADLYEKLTNLPAEVKVAIKFDIDTLPDWITGMIAKGANSGKGGGGGKVMAKALGGPAWGGNPYLVGERGPEFFVPQQSGHIIRSSDSAKLGGRGVTLNNWGTIVTSDGDPFSAKLLAVLQ